MQTVKVHGVQDRRSTAQAKLPWVVRYTIDGRHRGKSFRTRIEADRYRGLLAEVRVHEWSPRWLAEQWQEWQPRTRASLTEALARFITIAVGHGAKPPEGLRVFLYSALSPNAEGEREPRPQARRLAAGRNDRKSDPDRHSRLGAFGD